MEKKKKKQEDHLNPSAIYFLIKHQSLSWHVKGDKKEGGRERGWEDIKTDSAF